MVGSENTSNMGWLVGNTAVSKVALVYDQMNEPPRARMRVGLTALTMA